MVAGFVPPVQCGLAGLIFLMQHKLEAIEGSLSRGDNRTARADSESPTERNPASTVVSPEKVVLSPVESPYSDNIKLISKSKQTVVGTLDIQCESNFSGNSGGVNVGNDKVETIVVEGFSEQHVAEVAVKDASVNMMVVDGLNEPAEVTDAPMEWGSA
ncbi:hypothetical protein ACOSP7_015078 [Xanthoceras sorbifolium]